MSNNILGLHGVYPQSHDTQAALIDIEGRILGNVAEEAFTRQKRAFDTVPHNAMNYLMGASGVGLNDLEAITYGWIGPKLTARQILSDHLADQLDRDIPVIQVPHHEAHAASVFYTSPYDEAAILVVDGQGEQDATSIWKGGPAGLEKVLSLPVDQSLGYMYGAVSRYCALGTFGAGKLMGLAPYGEPKYVDQLADIFHGMKLPMPEEDSDSQEMFFEQFMDRLQGHGFPKARYQRQYDPLTLKERWVPDLQPVHFDLAASAQKFLEGEMLELARRTKQLTGMDNLCLAGGVAMNCVTNSLIQDAGIFDDVFMQPGCEDGGVAMGSALAVLKRKVPLNVYGGPSFTDDQIGEFLAQSGIRADRHENIAEVTAGLLAQGMIIGWFQGGLEYGPRALGNRSILADPRQRSMHGNVSQAKQREWFRPFGPSVLEEHCGDLFERPHDSPHMLRSFTVREDRRGDLAAVTHVDGSSRPQTVNRQQNSRYYDTIQQFYERTGVPAILNTSFNDHIEPIVASPQDALRTYISSGIGALVMGPYLLVK